MISSTHTKPAASDYDFYQLVFNKNKTEVEKLLCQNPAYANVCRVGNNQDKWSVLAAALYMGHIDIAKILILFGADLDYKSEQMKSLYDQANRGYEACYGSQAAVDFINLFKDNRAQALWNLACEFENSSNDVIKAQAQDLKIKAAFEHFDTLNAKDANKYFSEITKGHPVFDQILSITESKQLHERLKEIIYFERQQAWLNLPKTVQQNESHLRNYVIQQITKRTISDPRILELLADYFARKTDNDSLKKAEEYYKKCLPNNEEKNEEGSNQGKSRVQIKYERIKFLLTKKDSLSTLGFEEVSQEISYKNWKGFSRDIKKKSVKTTDGRVNVYHAILSDTTHLSDEDKMEYLAQLYQAHEADSDAYFQLSILYRKNKSEKNKLEDIEKILDTAEARRAIKLAAIRIFSNQNSKKEDIQQGLEHLKPTELEEVFPSLTADNQERMFLAMSDDQLNDVVVNTKQRIIKFNHFLFKNNKNKLIVIYLERLKDVSLNSRSELARIYAQGLRTNKNLAKALDLLNTTIKQNKISKEMIDNYELETLKIILEDSTCSLQEKQKVYSLLFSLCEKNESKPLEESKIKFNLSTGKAKEYFKILEPKPNGYEDFVDVLKKDKSDSFYRAVGNLAGIGSEKKEEKQESVVPVNRKYIQAALRDDIFEDLHKNNNDDSKLAKILGDYYSQNQSDQVFLEKAQRQYKIYLSSNDAKADEDSRKKYISICHQLAKIYELNKQLDKRNAIALDAENFLSVNPGTEESEIYSWLATYYVDKKNYSKALFHASKSINKSIGDNKRPCSVDLLTLAAVFNFSIKGSEEKLGSAQLFFKVFKGGKVFLDNAENLDNKFILEILFRDLAHFEFDWFELISILQSEAGFVSDFKSQVVSGSSETFKIIATNDSKSSHDLSVGLNYFFGLNNVKVNLAAAAQCFLAAAEKGQAEGFWWHAKSLLLLRGVDAWSTASAEFIKAHEGAPNDFNRSSCIFELSRLPFENSNNQKGRADVINALKIMCRRQLENKQQSAWVILKLKKLAEIDQSFSEIIADHLLLENPEEALNEYKKCSSQKEEKAQNSLGERIGKAHFLIGQKKEKENKNAALEYYSKAAEMGYVPGLYKIASMQETKKSSEAISIYKNFFKEMRHPKLYIEYINLAKKDLEKWKSVAVDQESADCQLLIHYADFLILEQNFFKAALGSGKYRLLYKDAEQLLIALKKLESTQSDIVNIPSVIKKLNYYLGFISKDYSYFQTPYSKELEGNKIQLVKSLEFSGNLRSEMKVEFSDAMKQSSDICYFEKYALTKRGVNRIYFRAFCAWAADRIKGVTNKSFKEYLHPEVLDNIEVIDPKKKLSQYLALEQQCLQENMWSSYSNLNDFLYSIREKDCIKKALKKEGIVLQAPKQQLFYDNQLSPPPYSSSASVSSTFSASTVVSTVQQFDQQKDCQSSESPKLDSLFVYSSASQAVVSKETTVPLYPSVLGRSVFASSSSSTCSNTPSVFTSRLDPNIVASAPVLVQSDTLSQWIDSMYSSTQSSTVSKQEISTTSGGDLSVFASTSSSGKTAEVSNVSLDFFETQTVNVPTGSNSSMAASTTLSLSTDDELSSSNEAEIGLKFQNAFFKFVESKEVPKSQASSSVSNGSTLHSQSIFTPKPANDPHQPVAKKMRKQNKRIISNVSF